MFPSEGFGHLSKRIKQEQVCFCNRFSGLGQVDNYQSIAFRQTQKKRGTIAEIERERQSSQRKLQEREREKKKKQLIDLSVIILMRCCFCPFVWSLWCRELYQMYHTHLYFTFILFSIYLFLISTQGAMEYG